MSNPKNKQEIDSLISGIAKFRAELLFDEFMGVFDKVPKEIYQALNDKYQEAIKLASDKLKIPAMELYEEIENKAVDSVNGRSYSQKDIEDRLIEYGIQPDKPSE